MKLCALQCGNNKEYDLTRLKKKESFNVVIRDGYHFIHFLITQISENV